MSVSVFMTLTEEILVESFKRFDTKTAKIVKERYEQIESDLVSAEARYYRNCQKLFYAHGEIPESRGNEGERSKGRPVNSQLAVAFESVFEYLKENEDCQYLMSDLKSI